MRGIFTRTPKEAEPDRVSRSRRRLRLALTGLAVLLVLVGARPSYHAFKAWRSRAFAVRAEQAIARRDLTNAVRYAQTAYLLRPEEPGAIRAAARVQTALGHPNALEFWRALFKTAQATHEDRRAYIDLCIQFKAWDDARRELDALLNEAPGDPETLFSLARLCVAQGRTDEALRFAREAALKQPQRTDYQLLTAILEYNSADVIGRAPAMQTLRRIAGDPSNAGLEAATFLARQTIDDPTHAEEIARRLEINPQSRITQHLLALDLRIRANPARQTELIEAAQQKYTNESQSRLLFADWLNGKRQFARTVEVLPLELAFRQRASLLLHLDALAGMNRWQEVQTILKRSELPLGQTYIEVFRARAAAKLNNVAESNTAWRRALQAAENNSDDLAFLARYAETSGEYEYARRAYRALAAKEDDQGVYLRWSQLVQKHGSTEELRDLMKRMAERWPEEIACQNDLAYLDLLLDRNTERSLGVAAQLVERAPESLPFRATLALGFLRSHDPAGALAAFRGRTWDWPKALPAHRAIYAACLAANGRINEARAHASTLQVEALRPEEQQLIQRATSK